MAAPISGAEAQLCAFQLMTQSDRQTYEKYGQLRQKKQGL
jgi:hypothetical protein